MEAIKVILFSLRKEIQLYESLNSHLDLSNLSNTELVNYAFVASNLTETQSVYKELQKRFPYLPIKIKPEKWESWVILHTQDDLKNALNLSSSRPRP